MTELTSAVTGAVEAELRFLDPAVNSSPELLAELLHPDFRAFGSSGRIWDRDSFIDVLRTRSPVRPVTASAMRGTQLAPDLVHLTFDTDSNGRLAHRSSLWRLTGNTWKLYFHQGTVFGHETEDDVPWGTPAR
ncbi:nuclear transport factor 2 family protein [Streptomyces sp. NBC_01317]|uniref:nuclear transport factor 2 family protein n=1 Tax=Streptomyces sp. NBC_01317 TaxID=2903822 RepID=UPI002E13EA97|nr:nuclear transport factor 2 family protein [Streptomyces sp. NBC_01317]